jgi:hypothetical protein
MTGVTIGGQERATATTARMAGIAGTTGMMETVKIKEPPG